MDLQIAHRLALVTGGSQGIGLAIAEGLAHEGCRVVISSREESKLEAAKSRIPKIAGTIPADVSDPASIERLLARTREIAGDPEILIINAGGPPPGKASELDDTAWAKAFQLTLMSAVRLARACLPAMRQGQWGRVIFVTSISVKEPIPNLALSNSLRAGVAGFARTLANEIAAEGITVNCVAPGATDTQRIRQLHATPESLEKAMLQVPARRLALPSEVAAAAVFLAGNPAAMITGQTLVVDGGATGSLF